MFHIEATQQCDPCVVAQADINPLEVLADHLVNLTESAGMAPWATAEAAAPGRLGAAELTGVSERQAQHLRQVVAGL